MFEDGWGKLDPPQSVILLNPKISILVGKPIKKYPKNHPKPSPHPPKLTNVQAPCYKFICDKLFVTSSNI
jgi:hypothetical protein